MRQNKQKVSLSSHLRRLCLLAFIACLSLAVVKLEGALAQQPANTNAQKPRTKRITPLRTSETSDGSRVTITSDGELNDYSAYRSGDRFIVVVPQAEGAGGGGARGRGFEGAQVERRGKDLVYTFKLQPGATARVNQRFNRLDVQFSAPKGGAQANARPTPSATPARRTLPEEAGITKPPTTNANTQATPDPRRTTDANLNNAALASATPFAAPTPSATATTMPSVTPTTSPSPVPAAPGGDQIAQAQPSIAPPTSITTSVPSTTAPTSVGAVVTRNWPWLLALLLAVGIGFLFVSRLGRDRDKSRSLPPAAPSSTKPLNVKESKTPELKPSSATVTTAKATGATPAAATGATGATGTTGATAASTSTTGTTAAATGAAATGAAAATPLVASGKLSKKKKKKAEKAKRLAAEREERTGGLTAAATTGTSEATTGEAATSDASTLAGGAIAATGAVVAGGAAALGGATEDAESKASETKAVEVAAAAGETSVRGSKAIEPSVAFDPERIEVEIKKLLAGESYDESIINATDKGTRQLVSAELMQAIGGRNAARQAHARTAFLSHGYFEEATNALQTAEAPGERAAAARMLGILGERNATPHLTAALEDPAADVRRTSVEALAELGDPAAIDALEALRWRETSRQVPRTLIQRAIEACKVEEEETTIVTASEEARTKELELAATTPALEATPLVAEATPTVSEEHPAVAESTLVGEESLTFAESPLVSVEEPDATVEELTADPELTVESPALAATETHAPEASFADAAVADDEETKAIEIAEPVDFTFTPAHADLSPATESAPAEIESGAEEATVAPVEIDLSAALAAKEANLIEARRRESEATVIEAPETAEPLAATTQGESPAVSFESITEESTLTTSHRDAQSQPLYSSDFAAGAGHPAVGDDDWIDLDATESASDIRAIEPAAPAEPLGTYYAEEAGGWSATQTTDTPAAREDETSSLFDTLEVEAFETNDAEPAPIVATPLPGSVHDEEAQTQPLTYERRPVSSFEEETVRGGEIVKAEKGVGLADGSDEDTYSIIPKGIQLRLASDDASERAQSVLALSRLKTDEAFEQICAAFDDPAEEVRNAAARAIYDLNEDRADSFTRALRESPVERRRHIGSALAGSGLAEEAIGNLTGESRDKTYDAFSLLFLMAKAGEVAPLIRAIESHPDNEVRLAVVKLLALSGQQEILPSFRRLAVRGSLPTEVRSAVMEAIYQISSQPNATTPAS
ncbi:MAG TPA: HEAT repeat domain-containing protein [Pyrinomonadaceae bacterium]|nr:HEAT repeat domain-containing protein [Pyrinomonadaceae bacterium]